MRYPIFGVISRDSANATLHCSGHQNMDLLVQWSRHKAFKADWQKKIQKMTNTAFNLCSDANVFYYNQQEEKQPKSV